MTPRALLPIAVLEEWDETFGPIPKPLRDQLILYAPPVTLSAVRKLAKWTADDRWLAYLGKPENFKDRNNGRIPYALFYTIKDLESYPHADEAQHLASELLGGNLSREAERETYYRDCIAVRTMLIKWLSDGVPVHNFDEEFIDWLKRNANSEHRAKRSRATTTLKLIQGTRLAGVKRNWRNAVCSPEHLSRVKLPSGASNKPTQRHRKVVSDRRLDRIQDTVQTAFPSFRPVETHFSDEEGSPVSEPADPDAPISYQRRRGDLRTPRDDRRALAKMAWLEGLSTSPTEFDIHRTPASHVVTALATLITRNERVGWAFGWLIATTALPPSRLRKTRVLSGPVSGLPDDEESRIDLAKGVLEYRLLDGPSGPPEADNRVVRLALPALLIAALQPGAVKLRQLDPESPFKEMESHVNGILRRNHKTAGGLTVTCQRIRAAAEAMILGLAVDMTAGLTLTGAYGHSNRGPAAYRVIQRTEIQSLFSNVSRQIASLGARHVFRDPNAPFPVAPETLRSGDGALGSIKTVAVETIPEVFGHLAQLAAEACERTEFERGMTGVHLDTLIQIQNISGLHTYLGLLLGTGIRPVADRTVVSSYGPELWLVADKDSVDFVERRVVPALHIVRQQLAIHRQLNDEIRLALNRRLLPIRDQEPKTSALPLLFERKARQAIARRVRQTDFMPIAHQFGWDRRATRHTFATELREQVPASELNALLGHAGGGWHRHGTSSRANQLFTPETIDAIKDLIDRAGFGLLDLRERYVT